MLWKEEEDCEKHYALTLSIVMFALLPAFLELLNTFAGSGNRVYVCSAWKCSFPFLHR